MKTQPDKQMLDAMSKNPDNWKGVLYFNPKDPRLIVPKYFSSMGWTLNFGNPYTYLIFAGLFSVIVAVQYLL
jgi:uncharacterized membrane protein